MTPLISFRGPIGCGKTFAAEHLVQKHGFTKVSLADALKIEVFDCLWEGGASYDDTFRQFRRDTAYQDMFPVPKFRGTDLYYVLDDDKTSWVNRHKVALRPLLQWWGTEYRRAQNENYWTDQYAAKVRGLIQRGHRVATDDARFDNEIAEIIALGGKHVFILADPLHIPKRLARRDGAVNLGLPGHASEGLLDPLDRRNACAITNYGSEDAFKDRLDRVIGGL